MRSVMENQREREWKRNKIKERRQAQTLLVMHINTF